MRANTDHFNAIWLVTMGKSLDGSFCGDFGFLIVEHHDGRNWKVPGALRPRGQSGLIEKAQWYIDNKPATSVCDGKPGYRRSLKLRDGMTRINIEKPLPVGQARTNIRF